MKLNRRNKKRVVFCVVSIILILIAGCFYLYKMHNPNSDSLGAIRGLNGKYKEAYVKETDYNNTMFSVIYDDPAAYDESLQEVCFTPSDEKLCNNGLPGYDLNIPPNVNIIKAFNSEEYDSIIDGYSSFQSSLQVVTVIIPVDSDDCNGSAYAFTTVRRLDDKISKSDCVKKALRDVNSRVAAKSPEKIKGDTVFMSKATLKKYLEKYKFEKFS